MAKTLELQFATEMGGTARITIDNPKEPINNATVKDSMNQIIAAGVFFSPTGNLVSVKFLSTSSGRVLLNKLSDTTI